MAEHSWDAERYARDARFVAELGAPVVDLLQPWAGERVLDLGCGDGALTARLAESGARVVGVDASAELVRAAVARGVDARVMDGQRLEFRGEFDAVFSNAALHWMPEADARWPVWRGRCGRVGDLWRRWAHMATSPRSWWRCWRWCVRVLGALK